MQQGTGDGSAALESHSVCRRVKTQEAGFLCTAKNTTEINQVPNDENLHVESKLIQVIPYGERQKERDQYDLKQPFPRKSLTSDYTPTSEDKPVLLGSEVSSGPL